MIMTNAGENPGSSSSHLVPASFPNLRVNPMLMDSLSSIRVKNLHEDISLHGLSFQKALRQISTSYTASQKDSGGKGLAYRPVNREACYCSHEYTTYTLKEKR